MKKMLLVPVMALLFCACNNTSSGNAAAAQSQEAPADWAITTKVKALIVSDATLSATARLVSVSTTNGVVTLTGAVPTGEDRDTIVKIAGAVDGVVQVDNQITITNN